MPELQVKDGEFSAEGLVAALGPAALTAAIVNMTVGSGILVLPALVARDVGRAAPLAYLLAAGVMGLVALCFAEAGARTSRSGGPATYARVAFGPYVGYLTGLLLWAGNLLAVSAVCAALVNWIGSVAPSVTAPVPRAIITVSLYAALVAANLRGVSTGGRVTSALSVLKIAALVIATLAGLQFVDVANVSIAAPPSAGALWRAAMLLVLAFSGMETALGASGEIRNPARSVPLALAASLGIVVVLYASIQFVAQGVLGSALPSSQAPLADAVQGGGTALHWLILVGGAATLVGVVAGDLLGTSRVIFALAEDGHLPRLLARVHPRTRVPAAAIVTEAVACALLALTGTFETLAVFASLVTVVLYISCCAAAWRLAASSPDVGVLRRLGRAWPLAPAAAILALAAMFAQASRAELLATVAGGVLASLAYAATVIGSRTRNGRRETRN